MAQCHIQSRLYLAVHGCKTYLNLNLNRPERTSRPDYYSSREYNRTDARFSGGRRADYNRQQKKAQRDCHHSRGSAGEACVRASVRASVKRTDTALDLSFERRGLIGAQWVILTFATAHNGVVAAGCCASSLPCQRLICVGYPVVNGVRRVADCATQRRATAEH
jgi:hypothetical protein